MPEGKNALAHTITQEQISAFTSAGGRPAVAGGPALGLSYLTSISQRMGADHEGVHLLLKQKVL